MSHKVTPAKVNHLVHPRPVFKSTEVGEQIVDHYNHVKDVLEQAMVAIGQNIAVTSEQKADILSICRLKVYDPKRTNYDNDSLSEEVMAHLKKHKDTNDFKAFFQPNHQNRIKVLMTALRHACTTAKTDLRGQIKTNRNVGLSTAANNATRKMARSVDNITVSHVLRMAVLRRFARENPGLLEDVTTTTGNKRSRQDDDIGTASIRRPNTNEADSFWGKFASFLADKSQEWGTDMKSLGWTQHINHAIIEERKRFPNDPIPLLPQIHTAAPVASMQAPQHIGQSSSPAAVTLPGIAQMTAAAPGPLQAGSRANIGAAHALTSNNGGAMHGAGGFYGFGGLGMNGAGGSAMQSTAGPFNGAGAGGSAMHGAAGPFNGAGAGGSAMHGAAASGPFNGAAAGTGL
ncbi:hypothetical protein C8F01DRAFT_1283530 [Mycena amicta]|nr:hypothetical protein C8F01DRAFT_1283530 [Mycena amicta]